MSFPANAMPVTMQERQYHENQSRQAWRRLSDKEKIAGDSRIETAS